MPPPVTASLSSIFDRTVLVNGGRAHHFYAGLLDTITTWAVTGDCSMNLAFDACGPSF
jgi:hypothetical protein